MSLVALVLAMMVAPPPATASPNFTATPLTPESSETAARSATGKLAQSDPELLARKDATSISVMVKLDVDPVASYTGNIDGLAATSPEVTGVPVSASDPAVIAYRAYLQEQFALATAEITASVPSAKVLASYDVVYGGFALSLPANRARDLLLLDGVAAVQGNELRQVAQPVEGEEPTTATTTPEATTAPEAPVTDAPATEAPVTEAPVTEAPVTEAPVTEAPVTEDPATEAPVTEAPAEVTDPAPAAIAVELPPTSPPNDTDATTFIGADAVWPSLGGRDQAGAGVIVGVIDTGIWPEHPMLVDNGIDRPEGGPWGCEFGDGSIGDAFTCNDKLIGAYAFLDLYQASSEPAGLQDFCSPGDCSARDSEGHGTHTATTAAGSYVESAEIFGIERGPISGVAPGASVIAYRALGPGGGVTGDLVAAIGQAVLDQVDILNYSISGSANPYDAVEMAFLDAYAAGIQVASSAGNSGPGASTANHASPWTTTVGASTFDRAYTSALVLTADDGSTFVKEGSTVTRGAESAPVILASQVAGYTGTDLCLTPLPADSVTGKIVVCLRGTNGRVAKGINVLAGGASGFILLNQVAESTQTDNHHLPTIHLEGPNAEVLAFLASHTGVTATWADGVATLAQGDIMAGFSSRGPIGDFLKPDVTAPGVQVIAGLTPATTDPASGPAGELYQAIAGTSMSAPHVAGASALLMAAHPDWTPGQVKSALMTSSVQTVTNGDGTAAGVFDRGAGSVRVDRAIAPVLTISETTDAFRASAGDPSTRLDLNIPSIYVDPLPGAVATDRTVTNVSGSSQTFRVTATNNDGLRITVTPTRFTLAPGASRDITVLIDALEAEAGWAEGSIRITPTRTGLSSISVPVVANVGEAEISFDQTCAPTTINRNGTTTCTVSATNTLPVAVPARIDAVATPTLWTQRVTSPARKTLLGATWSGTLAAAGPPTVASIDVTTGSPGGGYLPLSAFGIGGAAISDEGILNYNVPAFQYGGETYTRIGVVSNGYVVVGGGTSADVLWSPNGFPNPVVPNNVLAPFWTDLNPEVGGSVAVGTLTDGVDTWLIIDWEGVSTYEENAENTFQTWIQLGSTEGIWYEYGAPTIADDASGGLIGAEDRLGLTGVEVVDPEPGASLQVITTPPTAGGSVTFDYTLKGLTRGTWSTWAVLTTPVLDSVPAEEDRITVR